MRSDDQKEGSVFLEAVKALYTNPRSNLSEDELNKRYAEKFLVAFVDILGFSSMIENDPRGEKFIPLIDNAIKDAFFYAEFIQQMGNHAEVGYRIFSDNVCFWMPLKHHVLSVSIMLSVLSEFQLVLISRGVFCRGGLTCGYHYASDYILYGPALVEAVKLEHLAVNPFISISSSIIEDVQLTGWALQMHQFHKLSHAGPWFVNYLSKIFYIDKEKSLKIIEAHRNVIAEKIHMFNDNPKILSKYKWAADYHNDLVGMIKFKDECAIINPNSS